MAAHVLRLRLQLLLAAARGEHRLRSGVAFVATAVVTIVVCRAVLSLGDQPAPSTHSVVVLGAAAIVLAFFLGPMLTGVPDQLDPRRFAPFAVDLARLPWILALASLLSVPSLALVAVTTCLVVIAVQAGVPAALAVPAGIVGVLTAALAARVAMAVSAIVLPERRSRELTALITIPVIVIAFPVAAYFASLRWDGDVPGPVGAATTLVGYTPLGAAQAFLFHVSAGRGAEATASGLIAVVSLVALLALWRMLVRRLTTTTERPYAIRERSGLGWFALLPANAFGAVAARSLVYWLRDRRYIVNVIVVPVAGVLTVFPLMVAGVPLWLAALVPVPLMALFFGWLPHNDVAYDSTALWMHIGSGLRGLADRAGRLVPVLLVAVPVLAIAVSVTLAVVDRWHLLLPLIGLAAALLLSALGMSSIASVAFPYAVSRPGDSPFQQPQRSAAHGSFGAAGTFLVAALCSAPTIWLFVLTLLEGERHAPAVFWVGIASGVVALVVGVSVGAWLFERRGARLMEFVETT